MKKKALSLIEYILITVITSVVIATIMTSFDSNDFKDLFKYMFEFKKQTDTEVEFGPMTY